MALLAGGMACAQGLAADPERLRIDAERQAIERRLAQEQAACASQFKVNDCLDRARSRRRESLLPLREQELILDAEARRQRAWARQQEIAKRLGEREQRQPQSADPASVAGAGPARSAAGAAARASGATGTAKARPPAASAAKSRASAAEARAAAARSRQQAAAARQARIQERERRRNDKAKGDPMPAR